MDQEQKNDSTTDKPFVHDAAGCSLAAVFVVAVVWLVLLLICILGYFLGDVDFLMPSICAAAVTVICAAVEVPLLVSWGICHSRMQKGGQNRKNSPSDASDPQLCPHLESQEQNSGASQTDKPTPLPCVPQESDGQYKEVSKTVSPTRDHATGCFLAGMIVAAVIWLVLVSIVVFAYLSGDKSGDSNLEHYLSVTFLTIVFAAVEYFVWVLWQIIVYRGKRKEQIQNDSKPNSLFLDLAAIVCTGILFVLSIVTLVHSLIFALYTHFSLFFLPFWCPMGMVPLLVLWRLFDNRNKRRGQNENKSKSASLLNLLFGFAVAVGLFFLNVVLFYMFCFIICPPD